MDDFVNYALQAALIQDIHSEINGNCAFRLCKYVDPITRIGGYNPLKSNESILDKRSRVTAATQGKLISTFLTFLKEEPFCKNIM